MTQWPLSDVVEEMSPGLWIRRGAPPSMIPMHRHDDVEVNVVLHGQLHYLFGGQPLTVREGEIAVFWAAQPHGLIDSRTGDMCWLRSEEHTSELQSRGHLVCRLLLEKKNKST